MNNNAKLWVAALRSGKYEQGTGMLNRDGRMCCLGVACEVGIENGLKLQFGCVGYVGYVLKSYNNEIDCLPVEVMKWAGIWDKFGYFRGGSSLSALNDSGKSFAEIADIIESEPEGLFV